MIDDSDASDDSDIVGDIPDGIVDRLLAGYPPAQITEALRPLLFERRAARIEAVLDARLTSVTVVLENLHDPHNGAAAMRSAEALGLTAVHVVEAVEAFAAAPQVTIGCDKWIDLVRHEGMAACARALREVGFALYAAVPGATMDVESVPVDRPCALVFGNEHAGLSEQARALCDAGFAIPMYGFTRSFNLSVSVALATSRVVARRRELIGNTGDLASAERERLRARWYALGIRGVEEIVARHVAARTQG